MLEVEQFERGTTSERLRPYEKLLASDLQRMNANADAAPERAPEFRFPGTRGTYEALTNELAARERLGHDRFDAAVHRNAMTRTYSNALFALVALLFAILTGRLRAAIDESRTLVAALQRAFLAKRRELPNIDLGSVLISATRGSNVGGDTFDAFSHDGRYGMFLVADVSGKGIDAAVDTALIKYTIRTLFASDRDPGSVLANFARIYATSAERPETFVVLFLAVVDLADGSAVYASAGHEPAWTLRGRTATLLAPTGPIVGIEAEPHYETHSVDLALGDALVVTTDGLTESRDGRGRLLGAEEATVWLAEAPGTAQQIADGVVRRLRRRSNRITDDLAILVVRYAPLAAPVEREAARALRTAG